MRRGVWIAGAAVAAAVLAARSPLGDDYGNLGCHFNAPRCDEPAWPIEALAHGHFSKFVHEQPLMGPVSLVLRAPFVALGNALGADLTWNYRLGVLVCVFASALVALELARRSRNRGGSRLHVGCVSALAFVNPLVLSAIDAGHPEELLAAAGLVAAALLAIDRRWALTGLALGLAVATKAWAVLAVVPVLLAVAPEGRRRAVTVAAVVLLACYGPLVAGDPGRFRAVTKAAGELGSVYGQATPPNVWFFASTHGPFALPSEVHDGQLVYEQATGYAVSRELARVAHALVLLLAVGLAIAWHRGGGGRRPETLFALLASILLVRCVFDPGNHSYYHAAAALAVLGYEALRPRARLPWLAGAFIAGLWVITRVNGHLRTDTAFAWVYLGFAIPMLALMLGLALNRCRRSRSIPPTGLSPTSPKPATGSSRA